MSTVNDLESYQQFALDQAQANNAFNAQQAQQQMDFQLMMSNTAHQREMADLKAAGLNPILAANSGASVGSGAAASADTSAASNVAGILQQVLQAQSAREVAGMYNAATLAAASIAANASMYGSDMSYLNQQDHPNSIAGIAARVLKDSQTGHFGNVLKNIAGNVLGSSAKSNNFTWSQISKSTRFHSLSPSRRAAIQRFFNSASLSQRNLLGRYFVNGFTSSATSAIFRLILGR